MYIKIYRYIYIRIRALSFGVYNEAPDLEAPDFSKLPFGLLAVRVQKLRCGVARWAVGTTANWAPPLVGPG